MRRGDASLNCCGGAHRYCQGLIVTRAEFRRRFTKRRLPNRFRALLVLQYRIEPPRRKFRYAEPALIFRRTPTFVILSAGMPIKEPGLTWTNKNQLLDRAFDRAVKAYNEAEQALGHHGIGG